MWNDVPAQRISAGIDRQMIYGDRVMVCRLVLAPKTVTPIHTHVHEQMTIVERGSVDFFVEGEKHTVHTGAVLLFPSGIVHGATMLDEEVVLIDIFSPPREDFIQAGKR